MSGQGGRGRDHLYIFLFFLVGDGVMENQNDSEYGEASDEE